MLILQEMLQEAYEEGYAEGYAKGYAEAVVELLDNRFSKVPEELRQSILSEKNIDVLRGYHRMIRSVSSVEEFVNLFSKSDFS